MENQMTSLSNMTHEDFRERIASNAPGHSVPDELNKFERHVLDGMTPRDAYLLRAKVWAGVIDEPYWNPECDPCPIRG
jgi:hypothetical protein